MHPSLSIFSRYSTILSALLIASLTITAPGCGDDDDDDDDRGRSAGIVDINAGENIIRVGEGVVISTDITYSSDDVFDDGDNIVVVVKVPAGLSYRDGTAEVQGIGSDDSIGAQVNLCPSGDSFLLFDLDDNDLDSAENPDGDADARLTFTLDGTSAVGALAVQARANNNSVSFSCDGGFLFQDSVLVTVVS